jgi:hypothetical protein
MFIYIWVHMYIYIYVFIYIGHGNGYGAPKGDHKWSRKEKTEQLEDDNRPPSFRYVYMYMN